MPPSLSVEVAATDWPLVETDPWEVVALEVPFIKESSLAGQAPAKSKVEVDDIASVEVDEIVEVEIAIVESTFEYPEESSLEITKVEVDSVVVDSFIVEVDSLPTEVEEETKGIIVPVKTS